MTNHVSREYVYGGGIMHVCMGVAARACIHVCESASIFVYAFMCVTVRLYACMLACI